MPVSPPNSKTSGATPVPSRKKEMRKKPVTERACTQAGWSVPRTRLPRLVSYMQPWRISPPPYLRSVRKRAVVASSCGSSVGTGQRVANALPVYNAEIPGRSMSMFPAALPSIAARLPQQASRALGFLYIEILTLRAFGKDFPNSSLARTPNRSPNNNRTAYSPPSWSAYEKHEIRSTQAVLAPDSIHHAGKSLYLSSSVMRMWPAGSSNVPTGGRACLMLDVSSSLATVLPT